MEVGDVVTVKAPFDTAFPDSYAIVRVEEVGEDKSLVYFLDGIEGAFDIKYLESA